MKMKKKSEQSKKQTQTKTTPKTSPTLSSSPTSSLKPKTRGDEKKKSPNTNVSSKSNNNINNNTKSEEKESSSNTQEKQGVDNFLSRQAPRLSPRRLASKLNDAQQQNKLASNNSNTNSSSNQNSNSSSASIQKTVTNTSTSSSSTTSETPEGRRMSSRRRKPSWRVTAMESDSSDQQQNAANDGKGSSTTNKEQRKNSSPTRSEKSNSTTTTNSTIGRKVSQQQQQRKEDNVKIVETQQKQTINTSTDSARTSPAIIISKSKAATDLNLNLTTNPSVLTNGSLKITVSPTKLKTTVVAEVTKSNTILSKNVVVQKPSKTPEKVPTPIVENNKMEVEELQLSLPSSPSLTITYHRNSVVNGYVDNEQQQKRKTDNQESNINLQPQKSHHSEDFIVQAKRLKLANTPTNTTTTTTIASNDTSITTNNNNNITTTANFNTTTDMEETCKETQNEPVSVISLKVNDKIISPSSRTINNTPKITTTTTTTIPTPIQKINKINEQENSKVLAEEEDDDDDEVIEVIQDTLTRNKCIKNDQYTNNLRTKSIKNKKYIENTSLNITTNNLCCCNESTLNTNELRLNNRPSTELPKLLAVDNGNEFQEKNTKDLCIENSSSSNIPFEPFCQAIDLVDSQRFGCIRPATNNRSLYRPSKRRPFMLLCSYHVSRLKLHQCCPVCGYFCLQGGILLCTRDVDINLHLREGSDPSKFITHLFHRTCAIEEMKHSSDILTDNNNDSSSEDKNNNNNNNCSTEKKTENQQQQQQSKNNDEFLDSKIECPHCGHDSDINEISVRFQAAQLPVFLPERPDAIRKIAAATLPKTLITSADDLSLRYIGENTASRLANAMSEAKLLAAEYPKVINRPDSFVKALLDRDIARVMAALLTGDGIANIQFPSHNNESALHLAVRSRDICLVHGLLVCGSNPNVKDKSGRTPLMLTGLLNEPILGKYLIAAGANKFEKDLHEMNVVHIAAMEGCLEFIKSILEHHPDFLKTVETNGLTPLMVAAKYNHYNVVNYLASHWTSEINIRALDSENNTALHWSAKCGAVQAVSVLLQKFKENSDLINARNCEGQTSLHLAVTYCHDGCVLVLLVNGCDLSIKDDNGKTPLDLCIDEGNENSQSTGKENRESDIRARKAIKGCIIQTSTLRSVLSLDSQEGKILPPYRIVSMDISNGKETHGPIQCVNSVDDEDLPQDFTYITASVFRNNALTPPFISSSKKLKCKCQSNEASKNKSQLLGTCSEDCSCSNKGPFYDSNGRLLNSLVNHFNSSQLPVINECNQLCKCDFRQCSNRVVQKGIKLELQVFKTEYKGWGVKTLCHIPRGSFICTYEGEIVSTVDSSKQYHSNKVSNEYFFELYNHCILIDSGNYGNVSRFLNSSCSPNLLPIRVLGVHGHEDERYATIAFFAMRDIEVNEELCYDYGEKFWDLKISEGFTCDCLSEVCRYSVEPDNEDMDLGNDDELDLKVI